MENKLNLIIKKYLTEIVSVKKALERIYFSKITKASLRYEYFKKWGGEKWEEKYESCSDYKYYKECISGEMFKEEIDICFNNSVKDMEIICSEVFTDEEIENLTTKDLFYSYEQIYVIYRQCCL
jgi:hypothetical protein